jgi:hypothetical protein
MSETTSREEPLGPARISLCRLGTWVDPGSHAHHFVPLHPEAKIYSVAVGFGLGRRAVRAAPSGAQRT